MRKKFKEYAKVYIKKQILSRCSMKKLSGKIARHRPERGYAALEEKKEILRIIAQNLLLDLKLLVTP
ncbi:MAG: hypothetical protein AABZ61_06200 [Bacteroidota bacterium]